MRATTHRIDVWWADLTSADLRLQQMLPPAEQQRVDELTTAADRGRRLVAAALLQHAVAHFRAGSGSPVGDPVTVDRTCPECGKQHGPPVVEGGPHVTVSHAGVLIAVATSGHARVGIDVERCERSEPDPHAWVAAEALVKAGTTRPMATIAQLQPPYDGYVAALALAVPDAQISTVLHHWPAL